MDLSLPVKRSLLTSLILGDKINQSLYRAFARNHSIYYSQYFRLGSLLSSKIKPLRAVLSDAKR